jgi:hypothetical protein
VRPRGRGRAVPQRAPQGSDQRRHRRQHGAAHQLLGRDPAAQSSGRGQPESEYRGTVVHRTRPDGEPEAYEVLQPDLVTEGIIVGEPQLVSEQFGISKCLFIVVGLGIVEFFLVVAVVVVLDTGDTQGGLAECET